MKKCTKCNEELELNAFCRARNTKDGYYPSCKTCQKKRAADYYQKNKETVLARNKDWSDANKDHIKALKKQYRQENKANIQASISDWQKRNRDKCRSYTAKYREKIGNERIREDAKRYREENRNKTRLAAKKWQKENRARATAYEVARYAAKINATPSWADLTKIEEFYQEAERLSKIYSRPYHVDHVIPLRSKIVCGLHCEANLRVITADENRRKGNRHWPDMP